MVPTRKVVTEPSHRGCRVSINVFKRHLVIDRVSRGKLQLEDATPAVIGESSSKEVAEPFQLLVKERIKYKC